MTEASPIAKDEPQSEATIMTPTANTPRRTPTAALQGRPFAWVALFVVLVALLIRQDDASVSVTTPTVSADDLSNNSEGTGIERGKPLGSTITASDLHQAYRDIQEEYHAKAFGSKDWISLNKKDGIEVSLLKHPSDPNCPYVKMTAIMPVTPQECWDFLSLENWDKTMPHMDPFYEGMTVLTDKPYQHKGVTMTLARKRTKRLLAFGKRDFLFVSVSDLPKKDGTLVSGTVSIIAPQLVPRQEGYTRAFQDSIAFYEPIGKSAETTRLTIVCRIDMNDSSSDGAGGLMPMWIYVKTIGSTGARSVLSMRDYLEKEWMKGKAVAKETQQAAVEDDSTTGSKKRFRSLFQRRR